MPGSNPLQSGRGESANPNVAENAEHLDRTCRFGVRDLLIYDRKVQRGYSGAQFLQRFDFDVQVGLLIDLCDLSKASRSLSPPSEWTDAVHAKPRRSKDQTKLDRPAKGDLEMVLSSDDGLQQSKNDDKRSLWTRPPSY
jgi:hypothetical protein